MTKTITEAVVDGYPAQNVDFVAALGNASDEVREQFELQILGPVLAVLSTPGESAVLSVAGHADRVDTEGLSREQRRVQELQASVDRATNAVDAIKEMIRGRLGQSLPPNLDDLQEMEIAPRAYGGAVLIETAAVLSESQRRRNRRVMIRLTRFQYS
jgi:flagellar motor protein MotB